jgi:putative ABC transport system ATP-binding protein
MIERLSQMIHAENLTRIYSLGETKVIGLNRVNLDIRQGELVVLKGNSGSGKSTLLSLLGGLDQPSEGNLTVSDYNLNKANERELIVFRREVVGMIFQSFNLLPTLDVLENICLPGLLAGNPLHSVQQKAVSLIKSFDLNPRKHHKPNQLSGGEMQRTAIARALINDPFLILADEPTGNLDSRNGQRVIDLLVRLNKNDGRTVVIATHSSLADDFATYQLCLKDGEISDQICST